MPKMPKDSMSIRASSSRKRRRPSRDAVEVILLLIIFAVVAVFLFASSAQDDPPGNVPAPTTTNTNPSNTATGASITWHGLEDGLALAAAENRPVMVDFYADWCYWCHQLDLYVYTDADVISASGDFVCVKHDVEADPSAKEEYGAHILPLIVFMDSDGAVLFQIIGYVDAQSFLVYMNRALQEFQG